MKITSLVLVVLIGFLASPVLAEKRVALVIGNSAYKHTAELRNPRNDAEALAEKLSGLNFSVVEGYDLDHREAREKLREFGAVVRDADVALFFYAGHALQVDGKNYLLPVDARLEDERDLSFEALPMYLVQDELSSAKQLRLVILDACRDNPLAVSMNRWSGSRSVTQARGLARVETTSTDRKTADTLIAYATNANTTADDGSGNHSPYTNALLRHIATPGLDVRLMFGRVGDSVQEETNNRQEPFVYGSLGGKTWSFNPDGSTLGHSLASDIKEFQELFEYWKLVRETENPDAMAAFLVEFDHPVLRPLVEARMRELGAEDKISARQDDSNSYQAQEMPEPRPTAAVDPKDAPSKEPNDLEEQERLRLQALERSDEIPPRFIQIALADLGYYKGTADGILGPNSERSIKVFQQDNGFTATGTLTDKQRVLLIKTAAHAGHSQSQNTLAIMAGEGVGIPKDAKLAAQWFKAAADQGNVFASYNLGVLYRDGQGVGQSVDMAKLYFQLAKAGGNRNAEKALKTLGGKE